MSISCVCCMRGEGGGLCYELIIHAEESTGCVCVRVCVCLIVCALGISTIRRPRPALACCATKKKDYDDQKLQKNI